MTSDIYPLGHPEEGDVDELDRRLLDLQADMRRQRSMFEPPDTVTADPWLVPEKLWRSVQADDIRRQGTSLAVLQDGRDIAFNVQVEASRERAVETIRGGSARERMERAFDRRPASRFPRGFTGVVRFSYRDAVEELRRVGVADDESVNVLAFQTDFNGMKPQDRIALLDDATRRANDPLRPNPAMSLYRKQLLTGTEQSAEQARAEVPLALLDIALVTLAQLDRPRGTIHGLITEGPQGAVEGWKRPEEHRPPLFESLPDRGLELGPLNLTPRTFARALIETLEDPFFFLPAVKVGGAGVRTLGRNIEASAVRRAEGPLERSTRGILDLPEVGFQPRVAGAAEPPPTVLELALAARQPGAIGSRSSGLNPINQVTRELAASEADNALNRAARLARETDAASPGTVNARIPSSVVRTLEQAPHFVDPDPSIAGPLSRIRGVGFVVRRIKPSVELKPALQQANVAEDMARQEITQRLFPGRQLLVDRRRELFGSSATHADIRASARMPEVRTRMIIENGERRMLTAPYAELTTPKGTPYFQALKDIWEHPDWYDLTPDQREFIRQHDFFGREANRMLREEWGVDIGDYGSVTPQHGFVPSVDVADDLVNLLEIDPGTLGRSGRLQERVYQTGADRMMADAFFEPELNFDLLFARLDETKAFVGGRETLKWGIGGTLEPQAGFRTFELLERHFPTDEFNQVQKLLAPPRDRNSAMGKFLNVVEKWRQTVLGGDSSPLTGIQAPMGLFADPIGTINQWLRGTDVTDLRRPFTATALAEDEARDIEGWVRYARAIGRASTAAAPEEFQAGLLNLIRIPKRFTGGREFSLGAANEGMFIGITRMMRRHFDDAVESRILLGVPEEQAIAAAADSTTKMYPLISPKRLGTAGAQAELERTFATSVSYARQPAAHVATAMRGFVKLGILKPAAGVKRTISPGSPEQWARLTAEERLAVRDIVRFTGNVSGLVAIGAALSAEERGQSVSDALRDVLDPQSREFWRLRIGPDISIPLGGPYRRVGRVMGLLFQSSVGQEPEAIGDVIRTAEGMIGPGPGFALDVIKNRDFFGEQIVGGDLPENVLRGLAFAVEGGVPLFASSPLEAYRRGLPFREGVIQTVSQAGGVTAIPTSPSQRQEIARRKGAKASGNTPEVLIQNGLTPEQAMAAAGFEDIDELSERIGSRSADAYAEANSPEFAGERARYVQDLRRRAENGDRTAEALLVIEDRRASLAALEKEVRRPDGTLDMIEYSRRRKAAVDLARGKLAAFSDIFEGFEQSEIEIDRLTAQGWELWDQASNKDENGVVIDTNYDRLDILLEQFYSSMAPEMAALVKANMGVISPRDPVAEQLYQRFGDQIADSGYWDIRDDEYERAREMVEFLKPYPTLDDYLDHVREEITRVAPKVAEEQLQTIDDLIRVSGDLKEFIDEPATTRLLETFQANITWYRNRLIGERPEIGALLVLRNHRNFSNFKQELRALIKPELDRIIEEMRLPESPAETTSQPTSALRSPRSDTLAMAEAFLPPNNRSYGQIAIEFGIEGENPTAVVEQRLRRHFGGSPVMVRRELQTA